MRSAAARSARPTGSAVISVSMRAPGPWPRGERTAAGPPSVTGFAGGRPAVEEIVAYWPALIDRTEIEPHVKVDVLEA